MLGPFYSRLWRLRALELRTFPRRKYHVPGPLALWHVDGNHKLIRYFDKLFLLFMFVISDYSYPLNRHKIP